MNLTPSEINFNTCIGELWAARDDVEKTRALVDRFFKLSSRGLDKLGLPGQRTHRELYFWLLAVDVRSALHADVLMHLVDHALKARIAPQTARFLAAQVRHEMLRRQELAHVDRLDAQGFHPGELFGLLRDAVASGDVSKVYNTLWMLYPFGEEVFTWCQEHRVLLVTAHPRPKVLYPEELQHLPAQYLRRFGLLPVEEPPKLDRDALTGALVPLQFHRNSRTGRLLPEQLPVVQGLLDAAWSQAAAFLALLDVESPREKRTLYGLQLHLDGMHGYAGDELLQGHWCDRVRTVLHVELGLTLPEDGKTYVRPTLRTRVSRGAHVPGCPEHKGARYRMQDSPGYTPAHGWLNLLYTTVADTRVGYLESLEAKLVWFNTSPLRAVLHANWDHPDPRGLAHITIEGGTLP